MAVNGSSSSSSIFSSRGGSSVWPALQHLILTSCSCWRWWRMEAGVIEGQVGHVKGSSEVVRIGRGWGRHDGREAAALLQHGRRRGEGEGGHFREDEC